MSNASVKVECFHKPTNEPNTIHKLGYLFLQVKGAQTICPKSNDRVSNISFLLDMFLHNLALISLCFLCTIFIHKKIKYVLIFFYFRLIKYPIN